MRNSSVQVVKLACCVALMAFASIGVLVSGGCTNGKKDGPEENGADKPEPPPPPEDPRKAHAVDDRGQVQSVKDFVAAMVRGESELLRPMLSQWAAEEISVQYAPGESGEAAVARALTAYAAASAQRLAAAKSHGVSSAFDKPWRRPGDQGDMVQYDLVPTSGATVSLGFFLVADKSGRFVIDNVLLNDAIMLGESAPAINPAINTTVAAFMVYHEGAIIGRHPLLRADATGAALDTAHRLMYLRAACSPRFVSRIRTNQQSSGDILRFLDAGAQAYRSAFTNLDPMEAEGEPMGFLIPVRNNATGAITYIKLTCVRQHGQFRLDMDHGKVAPPRLPALGR